jgi:hypothetical protein
LDPLEAKTFIQAGPDLGNLTSVANDSMDNKEYCEDIAYSNFNYRLKMFKIF